jgi:hypothetical protein
MMHMRMERMHHPRSATYVRTLGVQFGDVMPMQGAKGITIRSGVMHARPPGNLLTPLAPSSY